VRWLTEYLETVDLRSKPSGCSQHPLVKLKKLINQLREGGAIRVVTDERVIPVKTIEVIAKKKGLSLEIVSREGNVVEVYLKK